ncbi:MAG: (2Fe-2S)-binding protein [Nitrososphaera sp.]|nr:(2Fe-2S)-binding protein [Nitrososphaera sp.]MCI0707404.1 (2Fe-2S)-binding protein [Ignavibacteriota bacterium]
MTETLQFTLNDIDVRVTVDSDRMLLWVLRTDLGLTGTKYGCGEGYCGSCTVLVENQAVRSCQTPVKEIEGKNVVTIEGLLKDGKPHPVQKTFMEHDAFQCGYCTPGMIINACSLLHENPRPSKQQIVDGMENNLCRCGAHKRILEAVQSASKELVGGR